MERGMLQQLPLEGAWVSAISRFTASWWRSSFGSPGQWQKGQRAIFADPGQRHDCSRVDIDDRTWRRHTGGALAVAWSDHRDERCLVIWLVDGRYLWGFAQNNGTVCADGCLSTRASPSSGVDRQKMTSALTYYLKGSPLSPTTRRRNFCRSATLKDTSSGLLFFGLVLLRRRSAPVVRAPAPQ